MRLKENGNGVDTLCVVIRNMSTSVTIQQGAPVFNQYTGSFPGKDVVSSQESVAADQVSFYGCSIQSLAPGAEGYAQMFGFMQNVRIVLNSRAASTDVYATRPAIAIGDILVPSPSTVGVAGWQRSSAVPTDGRAFARAANTYATQASSATATSLTSLSIEVATGKISLRSL